MGALRFGKLFSPDVKGTMSKQKQPIEENEFARQAIGKSSGFFAEFGYFLRHNKRWWLTPVFVILLMFGVLVVLGGSGVAPFIYTLF
jgi:hypothetical protein